MCVKNKIVIELVGDDGDLEATKRSLFSVLKAADTSLIGQDVLYWYLNLLEALG